jgi:DNA-directed RNA polymerase subunit RPC12/RpoP
VWQAAGTSGDLSREKAFGFPVSRWHTGVVWNPWRRITAVLVRASDLTYACSREALGWRCGQCDRGVIPDPTPGRRCPICGAQVVAMQRGVDAWVLGLPVLIFVAAWVGVMPIVAGQVTDLDRDAGTLSIGATIYTLAPGVTLREIEIGMSVSIVYEQDGRDFVAIEVLRLPY